MPFPLLELPPELYWMILHHVLVPGNIYPQTRPAKSSPKSDLNDFGLYRSGGSNSKWEWMPDILGPKSFIRATDFRYYKTGNAKALVRHPGLQILATCKRLHDDGTALLYGRNTFYLPRGQIELTRQYFDNLSPSHSALIRRMAIKLSITDLRSVNLEPIEVSASMIPDLKCNLLRMWTAHLEYALEWHAHQLRLGNPGLSELRLEGLDTNQVLVAPGRKITLFNRLRKSHPELLRFYASTPRIQFPPFPPTRLVLAYSDLFWQSVNRLWGQFDGTRPGKDWARRMGRWLDGVAQEEDAQRGDDRVVETVGLHEYRFECRGIVAELRRRNRSKSRYHVV